MPQWLWDASIGEWYHWCEQQQCHFSQSGVRITPKREISIRCDSPQLEVGQHGTTVGKEFLKSLSSKSLHEEELPDKQSKVDDIDANGGHPQTHSKPSE
jgi:hypothetical protein